jgi:tetratricopeptide (TPR) repeat protein
MFWSFYEWPDAVDYYWVRSRSPALRFAVVEIGGLALLAAAGLWHVRERLAAWSPVLLMILGWTASVVVFFVFSRYRVPVVPALALLAAVPVARALALWGERRRRAATGALVLIAAALAAPHLARPQPRADLVAFNLGRLAEERGDFAGAASLYQEALAANPELFLAAMNLGTLAARRSDYGGALGWYGKAVQMAPGSDDAWSNLGGALLAARRLDEAEAALARTLALNPRHAGALHNHALVRLQRGDRQGAVRAVERLLELEPDNVAAQRLAARLAAAEGATDE